MACRSLALRRRMSVRSWCVIISSTTGAPDSTKGVRPSRLHTDRFEERCHYKSAVTLKMSKETSKWVEGGRHQSFLGCTWRRTDQEA